MFEEKRSAAAPYFSICIPQYERTSFLLKSLESMAEQDFRSFEICISDDCSKDGREKEILEFLRQSGMDFVFKKTPRNLRYDGNLRASIALARGKFCWLMGNDDALASRDVLRRLHDLLEEHPKAKVALTNSEEFEGGAPVLRMRKSGILGMGADVAVRHFRDFSFIGGDILDRELCHKFATDKWDGSEMYQMYLGCRILSEGYELLADQAIAVRRSIQVPGEEVDSYVNRVRKDGRGLHVRKLPLNAFARVVSDATGDRPDLNERICQQLYLYPYTFWLFEFRRKATWSYAAGVARGMQPRYTLEGIRLGALSRMSLIGLFWGITLIGLTIPPAVFFFFYPLAFRLAKRAH